MTASIRTQIGSILIVSGTEIGAGILALPILTAKLGFIGSLCIMLASWLVMTYTALLVADINLSLPEGTSFARMARSVLGIPGEVISWFSFLMLLYAVSVAYISAASSAFNQIVTAIPSKIFAVIFVIILGAVVLRGVKAVDILNRFLSACMIIVYLMVCILLLQNFNIANLFENDITTGIVVLSMPVMVASFTSHLIIPSLRSYLDSDPKILFKVLLIGSIIPLLLYLLWILSVLGAVPLFGPNGFEEGIFSKKVITSANIGDVLELLNNRVNQSMAHLSASIFSQFAVITSYLGVSISLYHFLMDSLSLHQIKSDVARISCCAMLTFFVPLVIVLFYPNLFIHALGYVGTCVVLLLVIIPTLMAFLLKSNPHTHWHYRISRSTSLMVIAFVYGLLVIACEVIKHLNIFPHS